MSETLESAMVRVLKLYYPDYTDKQNDVVAERLAAVYREHAVRTIEALNDDSRLSRQFRYEFVDDWEAVIAAFKESK